MNTHELFSLLAPALDLVPTGMTIADARSRDHPLIYVNEAFERLTGYSRDEVIWRNCRFLQGPETSQEALASLRTAIAKGIYHRVTLLNYRRDGSTFWNDLQVSPIHGPLGQVTHFVGLQTDVSAEQNLKLHHRARALELASGQGGENLVAMEQVLDHVPFGLVLIDTDFSISLVNPKAAQLLGLEGVEWQGRQFREVLAEPTLLAQIPLPSAVREQRLELHLGRPPKPVGVTVVRSFAGSPEKVQHILVMRPLAEVEPSHQEMEQLRRLSALGRMAAGFAHQVRNPLAAVRSLAEAMREELDVADERREYTRRILALVERVENLVRRALRFTHSGAPRLQAMAPSELIHQALEIFEGRWREAGETAKVILQPGLPQVFVDRDHGVEILMVLIENALDATASPSDVSITATGPIPVLGATAGTFVAIEVRDRGAGIPAEVLSQIFEPFFTTKPRGTGLGLPIAMRLANESSARLEVSPSEGQGTAFRLLLPAISSSGHD